MRAAQPRSIVESPFYVFEMSWFVFKKIGPKLVLLTTKNVGNCKCLKQRVSSTNGFQVNFRPSSQKPLNFFWQMLIPILLTSYQSSIGVKESKDIKVFMSIGVKELEGCFEILALLSS